MLRVDPKDKEKLIDPLFQTGLRFWLTFLFLLSIVGIGAYFYFRQVVLGLGETGMDRPSYWGIYMVNFIFFIGISHAGTLISAILRVTGAEWRRPITRVAEAITAFALIVGTLQIVFDMGRPDRLQFVLQHGRLQSPILWDVLSVTLYFLGSVTYLYLPLIPDVAIIRDNFPVNGPAWRRRFYQVLSLGWRGNRLQWLRLEKAISIMAVFIIPIAVSVHTIISWILATTVQPGWHSSIFGPYFVVGAIFSGIGALFLAMTAVLRVLKLEEYISRRQYHNLGLLFIVMTAIWAYFTYAEQLGVAAGQQTDEFVVMTSKFFGEFAFGFWLMVGLMIAAFWILVVPQLLSSNADRSFVFRPFFGLAATIGAATTAVLLLAPEVLPLEITLSGTVARRFVWGLLILFVTGAGLGFGGWLKKRPVTASVIAAICVVIGMWLERWNIIVPTMTHARLIAFASYRPTMTEIALTVASLALFALLFLIFFKLFPAVSIWEIAEGRVIAKAQSKIEIPAPEPSEPVRRPRPGFRRIGS